MKMTSRSDLAAELFRYVDPLRSRYDASGARVVLPGGGAQYENEVIPFEAWARPLWGLAPFWAGGGRSSDGFFENVYVRGLTCGTNPASPSYWGGFRAHDQRFVEMAAIAYGLLLAPDVLWEPLPAQTCAQVATWLSQVNEWEFPAGNWLWFRALVNLALLRLGAGGSADQLAADLDELDSFALADGWYQDGPTGLPDYYNAMTFQFFSLLYVRLAGEDDPERVARYRERTRAFAADYVKLFSARGEGVPYGRSMTYRFAQAGFWSMALACGADLGEAFTPAVLKGLVERNLAAWDPARTCDCGGVLTVGYHYPNLHMAEGYNASGSPLWCLMAFACLALPEGDGVWQVEAAPLPALTGCSEALDGTAVVARDVAGEVTLFPSGRVPGHPFAQSDTKYSKFAYSSRFGFSVARSACTLGEAAPDSMLAFVINGRVFVRDGVKDSRVERAEDGSLAVVTRWSPWPGIEVETRVEPAADGRAHVRRHHVTAAFACEAYDCGFAVPGDYHELGLVDVERVCRVRAVGEVAGDSALVLPEANTNITCGKTLIPAVRYDVHPGTQTFETLIEVLA